MQLSAIQFEIYKKFVLVSLLHYGQVVGLPKATASSVIRTLRSMATVYGDFAAAYNGHDVNAVHKYALKFSSLNCFRFAELHVEVFKKDRVLQFVFCSFKCCRISV